jgi:heptosyltransferase-3
VRSFRQILNRFIGSTVPASTVPPRPYAAFVHVLRALRILRNPVTDPNQPIKRIFISHPFARVGDLVLLLPLLERIRSYWPDSSIDIAVGENVADLLLGVNGLNRVFLFNRSESKVPIVNSCLRLFDGLMFYRRQIMQNDYDLAIVPRWGSIETFEAVYLAYLTGAPERYGYSASVDRGDTAMDSLFTRVAVGGTHEQEAVRNVKLLCRLGLVRETDEDTAVANRTIQPLVNLARITEAGQSQLAPPDTTSKLPARYAVVSPGATAPFRVWPKETLVEALELLHQEFSLVFYMVGAENDASLCNEVAQQIPDFAVSLAGKTNLRQLVALISKASFFLGNDSGAAHIAGGLGVPCVVVSSFPMCCNEEHFNSPSRFRPCGPLVRVVQPAKPMLPCRLACESREAHCIRQVHAKDVVAAAEVLLSGCRSDLTGSPVATT